MERREKLENLASLRDIHMEVTYYRCLSNKVSEIAEKLNLDSSTVSSRFTRVFDTLHVAGEKELAIEYCPLLLEFLQSEDDLKNWGRIRAEMRRQASMLPSQTDADAETATASQAELPIFETQEAQDHSEATSESFTSQTTTFAQSIPPAVEQPRSRPPWYLVAIPILIFCLLCITVLIFGRRMMPFFFGAGATATETFAAQVPSNTAAPVPTETPPIIASETSLPTSTDTALPPTVTSTATNTPLPTVSPTSSIPALFFDDFNNGKSDQWQLIYGSDPVIVNGSLTFNDNTQMVIDQEWTDYELTFYVSNMQCQEHVGSRGLTVGLRVQDANNMVALRINDQDYCGGTWVQIQNSEWHKLPNSNFKLPPVDSNGGRQITIRVQGNTFSTPIGTSVVIENYATGGIAFIGAQGVTVDNVRVTPLTP